jgi:hypothetical protein
MEGNTVAVKVMVQITDRYSEGALLINFKYKTFDRVLYHGEVHIVDAIYLDHPDMVYFQADKRPTDLCPGYGLYKKGERSFLSLEYEKDLEKETPVEEPVASGAAAN